MVNKPTTFGQYLMAEALPDDVPTDRPLTKGELQSHMTSFAKKDPRGYVQAIQKLKKIGDEVSTWEGLSVGLDDIAPDYARRDPIMNEALRKVKAATTDTQRRKIIKDAEGRILAATHHHPSDMSLMARSGGRGSFAQLMKTVASPTAATDIDGAVSPWLITKSYAQGLNPADAWVANIEARRNVIASTGSVVEPGAVAKVVVTNMQDLVITKPNCKTTRGVRMAVGDQIEDRYLAQAVAGFSRDALVTPEVATALKKKMVTHVMVRSPMTCEVADGVCQKCMGLDEWGRDHRISTNVGVRSAQALTEPLTQFALNAKHGVRLAGDDKSKLTGLKGFRVLTEVPESFTTRAALAKNDGLVSSVKTAPQGGWHISVGGKNHYAPPGLKPIVREGKRVEAGDALTEGVAMPNEVVRYKGVGEGRRYLSEQLTDLYRRQGVDVDRRHTELLARKAINYVQVEDDPTGSFIPGEVVKYDAVQDVLKKNVDTVALSRATNKALGAPILHYSAGTRLTPAVIQVLRREGVSSVPIAKGGPSFTPVMKSIIQTPLMDDDWMSRLSHRYLKRTLVEGAGFGLDSELSGTNPVPAYALGQPFGLGPDGKYAAEISSFTDTGSDGTEDPRLRYDAHEDGKNVAYSVLRPESTEGDGPWISGMYVDPDHRGRGLAKALMAQIEADHEGQTLRLRARPYKDEAVDVDALMKIYEGMGFESYDPDEPTRMAKQAGVLSGLKRIAFGSGKKLDEIPGKKVISPGGAMDMEAAQARKIESWMPESMKQRMNLFGGEGQTLTDEAAERYRAIEELLPILGHRNLNKPGNFRFRTQGQLTAPEVKRLQAAGVNFTPEEFQAFQRNRGGMGRQLARGVKEFAVGDAPIDTLKQRFARGGVLGRGGLILGDMAIDPGAQRAWRELREQGLKGPGGLRPLGRLGMYGGMDAMNKTLSFGIPGYMAYNLATQDEQPPGTSRGGALGEIGGDIAGWGLGSPFGLVGGLPLAMGVTALGRNIGEKFDPPAPAPEGKATGPTPQWHQRLRNQATNSFQSHPLAQAGNYGWQGMDYGRDLYSDARARYERDRASQHPGQRSQLPPGQNQL